MPDYVRFCPVALASSVVADRWTPLILREMVLGSTRFNDIARGLPGISRSLLVQRLRHLERNGVIERTGLPSGRGHDYHLTPAGRDLEAVVMALGRGLPGLLHLGRRRRIRRHPGRWPAEPDPGDASLVPVEPAGRRNPRSDRAGGGDPAGRHGRRRRPLRAVQIVDYPSAPPGRMLAL